MPMELFKAGGWAMAVLVHGIIMHIINEEFVPADWRGGRIVDLFKNKGLQKCVTTPEGSL